MLEQDPFQGRICALGLAQAQKAAAVAQMEDARGWDILREALQDSDIGVRSKVARDRPLQKTLPSQQTLTY